MSTPKPVIVAYDISSNRVRGRVRKILREWSLGGQKSVHECRLKMWQAEELFLQLSEPLDNGKDRLLMAWLEPHRAVLHRGTGSDNTRRTCRHVK